MLAKKYTVKLKFISKKILVCFQSLLLILLFTVHILICQLSINTFAT